jgi:hypothetical protein
VSALGPIRRLALATTACCVPLALAAAPPAAPATPAAPQATFATPEEAAEALIAAAEKFDVPVLTSILGPNGVDLVVTEDAVQDKRQSAAFAALAREKSRIVRDAKKTTRATVVIGNEDWPMPIPLAQKGGRWSFDSKAGRQEVLFRRIGDNELVAIDICRGYVEAQNEYASERHDGAKINQYAQRIVSTPGKQDGLAWKTADGTWAGPVGEGIARVIAEGYTTKYEPYHGYYFKVLRSQGPRAPMGAMDFVVEGAMIGGFALTASPSNYGVTGIKSFIVSHDGVVYEKDFGKDTEKAFQARTTYDPDPTWSPVAGD